MDKNKRFFLGFPGAKSDQRVSFDDKNDELGKPSKLKENDILADFGCGRRDRDIDH